jgi:ParB family chromosome partitioning protein
MAQADLVAQAVDLDMVEAGWVPTVDNYLNCIPKARIVEAVREAKGKGTAQLLDHLKKGEMAVEAARLLKNTGWLPEVLRRADQVVLDGEDSAEGQLQSEYDHLTSDESIEEGIIANEYTFTESGRRFG